MLRHSHSLFLVVRKLHNRAAVSGETAAEWKQVLCKAHAADALGRMRNSTRRLLLSIAGGHSAYRDAKLSYLITLSFEVGYYLGDYVPTRNPAKKTEIGGLCTPCRSPPRSPSRSPVSFPSQCCLDTSSSPVMCGIFTLCGTICVKIVEFLSFVFLKKPYFDVLCSAITHSSP